MCANGANNAPRCISLARCTKTSARCPCVHQSARPPARSHAPFMRQLYARRSLARPIGQDHCEDASSISLLLLARRMRGPYHSESINERRRRRQQQRQQCVQVRARPVERLYVARHIAALAPLNSWRAKPTCRAINKRTKSFPAQFIGAAGPSQ